MSFIPTAIPVIDTAANILIAPNPAQYLDSGFWLNGYYHEGDGAEGKFFVTTEVQTLGQGGIWFLMIDGTHYAVREDKEPVKAAWWGAVADNATFSSGPIQAAHDYCEARFGGTVILEQGGVYSCGETLEWDCRLVGLNGYGATLNFAGSIPGNVGTDLVTGQNSTFSGGTGTWTFVNASVTLDGTGVNLANTGSSEAYGWLPLVTIPGTWYSVKYTSVPGVGGAIMEMFARTLPTTNALNFQQISGDAWFTFKAESIQTYLVMKLSEGGFGSSASCGSITVKVGSPPALMVTDNSTRFAYVMNPGTGYSIGDILTITGGTSTTAAQIIVTNVDVNGIILKANVLQLGTYTATPLNPVSVTGGTGTNATFFVGLILPGEGNEAYPIENLLIFGDRKIAGYVVDSVTEFSVYTSPEAQFGLYYNTPLFGTVQERPFTASNGTVRNIVLNNFCAGVVYGAQAARTYLEDPAVVNCNFGILSIVTATDISGNNINNGSITGCDVNAVYGYQSTQLNNVSLNFPLQAQVRVPGFQVPAIFVNCHLETAAPGLLTLLTPYSITGEGSSIIIRGGDFWVTPFMTPGSFNQIMITTSDTQDVIFDNVFFDNIQTTYLVSGPAQVFITTPSRIFEEPHIPTMQNDQSYPSMEKFGAGDFENPVLPITNPSGLISVGSNLDATGTGNFTQVWNTQFDTDHMNVVLGNTTVHHGAQSLQVHKKTGNTSGGRVYFAAPTRPGYQYWWTFWINVPTPTGSPTSPDIDIYQSYQNFGGFQTFLPLGATGNATGASNQALAQQMLLGGPQMNVGAQFPANVTDGLTINTGNGTGGWQFWRQTTDTTAKCPSGTNTNVLTLDFSRFDGVGFGNISCYLDEVRCWEI